MPTISLQSQKYLERIESIFAPKPETGIPKIHADEVSKYLASFFEKIRNIVDYQEEHLLIKRVIERILRRRLMFSFKKEGKDLAGPLIIELIRDGYIPNDTIEEIKIREAARIIDKYLWLLDQAGDIKLKRQDKKELIDWIFGIASCEIEECLTPPLKEKALLEYMYNVMKERVGLENTPEVSEEEKNLAIFIASQIVLLRSDNLLVAYRILRARVREWFDENIYFSEELAQKIFSLKALVEKTIRDKKTQRTVGTIKKHLAPFLIIPDVVLENPKEAKKIFANSEALESKIKIKYGERFKKLVARLKRVSVRMVVSIFLSKILVAFLVEIPLDQWLTGKLNPESIGFSILVPPILMLVIVYSIKPPGEENLNEIILETMGIVYEHKEKYPVRMPKRRGTILETILKIFYFAVFLTSFGAIIFGIAKLNFSIIVISVFLIFLCLIAFSGAKTRSMAKELEVGKERDNFITFLFETFSLPIVQVGRWLSAEFYKINFLVFILNFILEAPLQVLLSFIEDWRGFIREKKEEIH